MAVTRSFSTRLVVWFVALAIGPAAIMAAVAFWGLREADETLATRHLQITARARADAILARLDDYRNRTALVTRPLAADGVVYGLARADGHVSWPDGTQALPELGLLRAGRALRRDGEIWVAAPRSDGGAVVARIPVAALLRGFPDRCSLVDADGVVFGGQPASGSDLTASAVAVPWRVVVAMPRAEATGPLESFAMRLLSLGACFFLVVIGLLLILGRKAERELRAMAESVEKATRGEFGAEIAISSIAEIDAVRDGLNAMHKRLGERDAEIMRQRQELFCQRCELERLNTEIVQADQMKSEFVANMSHEVRTPLHSILTLSEILEGGSLDAEQRKQIGIIERSGRALLAMLGDILDFSKIEAGRVNVLPSDVAPGAALAAVREAMVPQAGAKGLTVVLDVPEGMPPLRTDPEKLHRILLNLAHNAVKFTEAGEVVLRSRPREGGGVQFEVADTGPGIPADQIELIFEPFRQLDGSMTRSAGGTGLGLSIARSLTELLGGRIAVESKPAVGTTFRVVLPGRIPVRGPAGGRLPGETDLVVVGATPPSGEALRLELMAAGFHVGRAVCGRDVRRSVEDGGAGTIVLDTGIFESEGMDVFSFLAPQLADRDIQILGYWIDAVRREGGYVGAARFVSARDGYALETEKGPPLFLPKRVGEADRQRAGEWARGLRSGAAEPFHAVVRHIVEHLDEEQLRGEPRRVLLLDPDEDTRYSMSLALDRMGHEVLAAGDLDTVPEEFLPELVVTELKLPKEPDAVAAVRERFGADVVVCTADARAEARAAALRAGAVAVFVKPVPVRELAHALRGAKA